MLNEGYYFGHCAFEIDLIYKNSTSLLQCVQIASRHNYIHYVDACSLKLFNGETMYPDSQRHKLKEMLFPTSNISDIVKASVPTEVCGEPEALVVARKKSKDLDHSDLEKVCEKNACKVKAHCC